MASKRGPETITCPFNKFHQILPRRIHYHLIKCAKNYPDEAAEMQICPYNATHLIPKSEDLGAHMDECLDRRIVEVQHYNVPIPGQHGYLRNPPVYGSSLIKIQEEIQDETHQDQPETELDQSESETTMSSLNRSQMLRDVLHYRRPNHRDLSPNATWSVEKEIQRLKRREASPGNFTSFYLIENFRMHYCSISRFFLFYAASATSSPSTSPTPPRVLRRPNIIVEDDRRYSRASALSLDKLLAARSARLAARSPVTERASFAYDK